MLISLVCFFAARASTRPSRRRTRTLGHRYREQSLAVGSPVYILGCVVDGQGQPMIARSPKDRTQKFLISRRGERELAGAAASAARNAKT